MGRDFRAGFVLMALLVSLAGDSAAQHGHWLDKYQDALGTSCCTLRDCRVALVRLLQSGPETTVVEVAGVPLTMPSRSVHASEEVDTWVCFRSIPLGLVPGNIRCVFVSSGG